MGRHDAHRPDGSNPALRPGLRVDRLGTEVVVLDAGSALVHRLAGPAAEVLDRIVLHGHAVADLPGRLGPAVAGLRAAGVLRGDVARRQLLGAGAAGAVGILTLPLPASATAASDGDGGALGGAYDDSTTGSTTLPDGLTAADGYTYRVYDDPSATSLTFDVEGTGTLTVDILLVGGGGAGGGGRASADAAHQGGDRGEPGGHR